MVPESLDDLRRGDQVLDRVDQDHFPLVQLDEERLGEGAKELEANQDLDTLEVNERISYRAPQSDAAPREGNEDHHRRVLPRKNPAIVDIKPGGGSGTWLGCRSS